MSSTIRRLALLVALLPVVALGQAIVGPAGGGEGAPGAAGPKGDTGEAGPAGAAGAAGADGAAGAAGAKGDTGAAGAAGADGAAGATGAAGIGVVDTIDATNSPWSAVKTGATDASTAINTAIGTLGDLLITNPYFADPATRHSGVVQLPVGKYLIRYPLLLRSGVTLRGSGAGTVITCALYTPAAPCIMYDTAHPAVGTGASGTHIQGGVENLSINGTTAYAQTGIYLANVRRPIIRNVTIEGMTTYGIWIGNASGNTTASYANLFYNEIRNCPTLLHVDALANAVTDTGSMYQQSASYAPTTARDYMLEFYSAGNVLTGVQIEGKPLVAKVYTAVGANVTLNPGWIEGRGTDATPALSAPDASPGFQTQTFSGAYKRYLNNNWPLQANDTSASLPNYPFRPIEGTPHFLPEAIQNPGKYGVWSWTKGGTATGTLTWDAAKPFGNGRGALKLTKSSGTSGQSMTAYYTIPAAVLAKYVGRRLYVTFSLFAGTAGVNGTVDPYLNTSVAGQTKYSYSQSMTFGTTGWKTYEIDIPLVDVTTTVLVVMRFSGDADSIWFTDVFAYLDGWDWMPFDRETKLTSAAVPDTGTWAVGDRVMRATQAVGQIKAWTVTTGGDAPATAVFTSEGNL